MTSNLPQLRKYSEDVEKEMPYNDPNYMAPNKDEGKANNGYIGESHENWDLIKIVIKSILLCNISILF